MLCSVLYALFSTLPASGAGLLFGVHNPQVGVGQVFEVGVFLNTEGAELNAVEGSIVWSKDSFNLEEVRDGNSIVSLWVERPALRADGGGVHFTGVLPGGFVGTRGYLFSVILQPERVGQAGISTTAEQLLLNDGQGTAAPITRAPLKVMVVAQAKTPGFLPPYDAEAPEPFTPELARDPGVFGGQWFVVFATQDKGSGLSHYEVQEKPEYSIQNLGFRDLPFVFFPTSYILNPNSWRVAESPYRLRDQGLHSSLWVRAIDRAGNVRLAQLPAAVPLPWYFGFWLWVVSAILVALGTLLAVWFTQHRNAKPTTPR